MPRTALLWLAALAVALGGEMARTAAIALPSTGWLLLVAIATVVSARAPRHPTTLPLVGLAVAVALGGLRASQDRNAAAPPPALAAAIGDRHDDVVVGTIDGPLAHGAHGVGVRLQTRDGGVWMWTDAALAPGDRVTAVGRLRPPGRFHNPDAGDRTRQARQRDVVAELTATDVTIDHPGGRGLWRWADGVAARWRGRLADAPAAPLLTGVVLGDQATIDDEVAARWRSAGVFHALSVSGLHLAIVALGAFALVRRLVALSPLGRCGRPATWAAAPALLAAIGYAAITGAAVATQRALIVVALYLLGHALARPLRLLDALAIAAGIILLRTPIALRDPSFQLSFVAALTLAAVARAPAPRGGPLRRLARWLWQGLRSSAWVTATTAPITAAAFGQVAWGGIIGNLLVAPLLELLVLPLALAAMLLADVVPAADAVARAITTLAGHVAQVADHLAAQVAAVAPSLDVSAPGRLELVLVAGALATGLAWQARRIATRTAAVAVGIAALAIAAVHVGSRTAPAYVEVTFVDVGQGDAAIVELPTGEVWLVDAGGNAGAPALDAAIAPGREIARLLAARGHRRVDVAIVSHPHPDHYLGLLAVAEAMPIGELWFVDPTPDAVDGDAPRAPRPTPSFAEVAARLAARGTRLVTPPLGVARVVGTAQLVVLAPVPLETPAATVATAEPVRTVNDNSIVVALEVGPTRVLLLGDVEAEGEAALVARGGGRGDIVKVAHHGSRTSSTPALIAASKARLAIVSAGAGNRFGLPNDEVIDRWTAAGVTVLRTDLDGAATVRLWPDGAIRYVTVLSSR